jgi:excisionase family DNA binding protein
MTPTDPAPARPPRALHHADLAVLWGCSRKTILRLIRSGELPAMRLGAKTFVVAEVDAALFYATRKGGLSASGSSGASSRGGRPWGSATVSA